MTRRLRANTVSQYSIRDEGGAGPALAAGAPVVGLSVQHSR